MAEWTLSVTELNEYVRKKLAGDPMLRAVRVSGEISGFKKHVSGHLYFTLKDENARVSCAMFRQQAMRLNFRPEDGQKVIVTAAAGLYPVSGTYQLYVDEMEKDGKGDLFQRFEALKRTLQAEGLFDPALKKSIPVMPKTIGVATSRVGAAFQDIVRVARSRNPMINILIAPCAVQGAGAAEEIAEAVARLNADGRSDVILVGRGGGSMEDLWAFNEEIVARAIFASKIPVISCVGHEIDFTIADFVADARAATPSNAAEIAVPEVKEMKYALSLLKSRLAGALKAMLGQKKMRLYAIMRSAAMTMPEKILTGDKRRKLDNIHTRMKQKIEKGHADKRARLNYLAGTLAAMDPSKVLTRGYAVIRKNGKAVSNGNDLLPGDAVSIEMSGGQASARIEEVFGKEQA